VNIGLNTTSSASLYSNLVLPEKEKPRRQHERDRLTEPPRKKQMTRPLASTMPIPSLTQTFQTNALFVGNLKWWTRDQDLLNIFSQFGTVTALKIHADKINGKSKGYAYIEYSPQNPQAAAQAKAKLHGFTLHGGKLTITFASVDKIKLPEFSNTPYSNPSAPKLGGAPGLPGMDLGALGNLNLGNLPAINPVSLGLTNTDLLKKLNLGGSQGISSLLNSLKGKARDSHSRSGSYSSRSNSRSRSYSRSRSPTPRKKRKVAERRVKKERERRDDRGGRDRKSYRSRRDR